MLRGLLVAIVLLGCMSACTGPVSECRQDGTCLNGGVCDPGTNLCFVGTGENEVACEPRCAAYQACVTDTRTCMARYTDLVVTPATGTVVGGSALTVRAELRVATGFSANYPERLSFTVVPGAGGAGVELTAVTRESDGIYTAQWTPQGEGVFRVTAAFPESGGPSASADVTVDTTAPVFAATVPPASVGAPEGGTVYADPAPGFATAWRRDQVVPVEVRTDEPNLEPGSVTVALQGTDGVNAPAVAVTPFTEGCTAKFCGRAELKLWEPVFNAFRSSLAVVIQGRDTAGNVSGTSPSANVSVTRWIWALDAQGGIKSTPAIGQLGTVYFGTESGSSGKAFALRPNGTKIWERSLGAISGSPAVGAWNDDSESVYIADNSTASSNLYALNGVDGVIRRQCTYTTGSPSVTGATAVLSTTVSSAPVETGLFVVNGYGSAIGIRPDAAGSQTLECVRIDNSRSMPSLTTGGSLVAENGGVFHYPTETKKIVRYAFDTGGALRWSADPSAQRLFGLALAGDRIIGSGGIDFDLGGVFSTPRGATSSPGVISALADTATGRVYQSVVGGNERLYLGQETASSRGRLVKYDLSGTRIESSVPDSGVFQSSPVLGAGGILYTVSTGGDVSAWASSDLRKRWVLEGVGTATASLTLDCLRDSSGHSRAGSLGVLYVAAGGRLYAFVVDSPGLDPAAPWPKYQHDARNTGNPATPITSCPAP